jgi:deoxycytidylate deaminase
MLVGYNEFKGWQSCLRDYPTVRGKKKKKTPHGSQGGLEGKLIIVTKCHDHTCIKSIVQIQVKENIKAE